MKIALIGTRGIPPTYGGTEIYVERLSLYLAGKHDEVIVYCKKPSTQNHLNDQKDLYPDNIKRIEIGSIPTKHLDNFSRTLFSTMHACLDSSVQVIQFNNIGPAFFSFLPRLFGKKVVGAIRAIDSQREKWNPIAKAFLRLCDFIAVKVPHVTTVNALSMQEYYLNKYQANTVYIPNGINIPAHRLEPNKIKQWGLEEKNYILFAARLEPEKGCHTLIKAYKNLISSSNIPVKLAIAGHKGFSNAYVNDLLRNESDRICFLDYVKGETMEELYGNAFAFVLPSAVEGMSNSLLSAMSHGIPVIVSDIPENTALIQDAPYSKKLNDQPGLTFHLEDANELSSKLRLLINNPEAAKERGALLQSHVRDNFDLESMGRATRKIYSDLLLK